MEWPSTTRITLCYFPHAYWNAPPPPPVVSPWFPLKATQKGPSNADTHFWAGFPLSNTPHLIWMFLVLQAKRETNLQATNPNQGEADQPQSPTGRPVTRGEPGGPLQPCGLLDAGPGRGCASGTRRTGVDAGDGFDWPRAPRNLCQKYFDGALCRGGSFKLEIARIFGDKRPLQCPHRVCAEDNSTYRGFNQHGKEEHRGSAPRPVLAHS